MAQIRQTIELLLKILHENGATNLKAEIFRQAKFDYPEATQPLWILLFELLFYCENGVIDEVATKATSTLNTAELVVFVKHEIQKLGFFSFDFVSLPNDMSSGSRELLLALGWLMCKGRIITQFMLSRTSTLCEDAAKEHMDLTTVSPRFSVNNSVQLETAEDKVHQLLWLNNKLRLSLKTLQSIQREKTLLKHKLHAATYGKSTSMDKSHLSSMEVYMLRNPEMLKKNLILLEKDNERLQNLLRWKDHEEIFWKWMESVLDTKLKQRQENGENKSSVVESETQILPVRANSLQRLHESRFSLQEAIVKYETILEYIESLWKTKISEVTEEELDGVLVSLELEISIQQANIALNNCTDYLYNQPFNAKKAGQGRLQYEKEKETTSLSSSVSSSAVTSCDTLNDIQEEIGHLQGLVEQLQVELESRQDIFQSELNSLSQKLQDSIIIPPMQI